MSILTASDLAPNLLVGAEVVVAPSAELGANVVIHDQVKIGEGARIDTGAVVGRVSVPNRHSRSPAVEGGPTLIAAHAAVGVNTVVAARTEMGPHSLLGDLAIIREGVSLGTDTVVGSQCAIAQGVPIGDRVRMQNQCVVGPGAVIEEDAFLGPCVQLLTGRVMNGSERRPPPVLRRGCQIGAGAVIMGGVEIGQGAVVGAGSIVTSDVEPGAIVRGAPARRRAAGLAEVAQLG